MTHLYVIRHAQPDGRKPEIIGLSPPDSGLSLEGVSQSEWLRDRLATTNVLHVDVLISNPMRRAKETAEILAPVLFFSMVCFLASANVRVRRNVAML